MTSDCKITLGLIGLGNWGKNYLETIKDIPEINLKYICTKEKHHHKLLTNTKFTNNYKDILTDPEIDAVIIATPQETHYKIAKDSLLANKNILLEKPMASTSDECLDLIKLSKATSKIIMVGHIYLHNPFIKQIKQIINNNLIGKIRYIYSERCGISKNMTQTGAMWELAPHDVYIINYLLNEKPIVKFADGAYYNNVCDSAFIQLNYNNIKAFIRVSRTEPKKSRKIIIVGEKGTIIFDELKENKLQTFVGNILKNYESKTNKTSLQIQCEEFARVINNKSEPLSSGEQGYETVKILEEIQTKINRSK